MTKKMYRVDVELSPITLRIAAASEQAALDRVLDQAKRSDLELHSVFVFELDDTSIDDASIEADEAGPVLRCVSWDEADEADEADDDAEDAEDDDAEDAEDEALQ